MLPGNHGNLKVTMVTLVTLLGNSPLVAVVICEAGTCIKNIRLNLLGCDKYSLDF